MAVSGSLDLSATFGFTDSRLSTAAQQAGMTTAFLTEDNNYGNMFDIDTRLSAINAGYWTVAMLRAHSKNDKIYALRLATADSAGIN